MTIENRLKLIEISTRILAKGSEKQTEIFAMYLDLGIKAINDLGKRESQEKAIRDAKNKQVVEEGNKKAAINKQAETKVKTNLKDRKPKTKSVQPKKVVETVSKEKVKVIDKGSTSKTDPKVN